MDGIGRLTVPSAQAAIDGRYRGDPAAYRLRAASPFTAEQQARLAQARGMP